MARYLGLDLGSKTIGIAKSDGIIPSVLTTLRFTENNFDQACDLLVKVLDDEDPEKLIIGLPKNMDNSEGHRAEMVYEFVDKMIEKKIWKKEKIEFIDERLTTRMAKSIMISANTSRKNQKQSKDEVAAMLILETFLNKR